VEIRVQDQGASFDRWADWHILTVAEVGFSMLTVYGGHHHGLGDEVLERFAGEVNERDEGGTLHPRAPISALPRRFFRDVGAGDEEAAVADFERQLVAFLGANRDAIRARRLLVDLHVSADPVPPRYLEVTVAALRREGADLLDEVVLLR
jgi:hypothetical protein